MPRTPRGTRRRAALLACAAAAVLLVAGCGDDSSDGDGGGGSDEEEVRAVMTAFLEAARAGDGQAACAELGETYTESLPEACEAYFSDPDGPGADVPAPADITVIRVEGDTASASPEPGPGGVAAVSYLLQRDGEEWRIVGSMSAAVPETPAPAGGGQ